MTEPIKQRGRPPQSEEQKQALRLRIIDAARTMFLEQGFEKVSMRKVAAQAGLNPTTLYHYFHNKRHILHFLWEELFQRLSDCCMAAIAGVDDPLERIRVILTQYIKYWVANPDHYRVIFMIEDLSSTPDEDMNGLAVMSGMEAYQALVRAIDDARQRGMIQGDDTELIWQALLTQAQGIVTCLITVREIPWRPVDALIEQSIGTSLKSLL